MKKSALIIAALTMVSVAAQTQPGQNNQSGQTPAQSQPGQPAQPGEPRQPGEPQPGLLDQSGQGQPAQGQTGQDRSRQEQQRQQAQQQQRQQGQQRPGQEAAGQQGQYQTAQPANLRQYIDFKVVDKNERQIGTVEALWEDQTGQPAFLAIKREGQQQGQTAQQTQPGQTAAQTEEQRRQQAQQRALQASQGGQQDQLLVIPAQSVEVNRAKRTVRVPYEQQVLQNAPTLREEEELNAQAQTRITAFYRQHGYQPRTQTQTQRQQGQVRDEDRTSIDLHEETVTVGRRIVEDGGVVLKKVVRTDTVSQPLDLRREELVIERTEGSGRPAAGQTGAFQEEEIYIPLRREVPVVQKEVEVKETVEIGKDIEQEQREITEQVREEELRVIEQQRRQQQQQRQQGQQPRRD